MKEEKKIEVALAELQERRAAAHAMRDRSMQFVLWLSGMAIGLSWLLVKEGLENYWQRASLTVLIAAVFGGTILFVLGLRRGFQNNRHAMVDAEHSLQLHEPGVYIEGKPLLPHSYTSTKPKWSDHFSTILLWIALLATALFVLTWTCAPTIKQVETVNITQRTTR